VLLDKIDPAKIVAMAVDGTSSTLLLCDAEGTPLTPALMYNDARATAEANDIAKVCDPNSGAQGATSALAKLLWFQRQGMPANTRYALHQADWIASQLTGNPGVSDWNNALKLGFDVVENKWPAWIQKLDIDAGLLPEVHAPGRPMSTVSGVIADKFGLSKHTIIKFGTTDSIAAFIASGARQPGQAVTSLGSTLAVKLLTTKPVFSAKHGVYSHRLGNLWLAGGASNSGGAALLQHFSLEEIQHLTPELKPDKPTGLNYYPLPTTGERFPLNDPELRNRTEPRPQNPVEFFQGLLEGIADIERQGYLLLQTLGAGYPDEVFTSGGGATNKGWAQIRQAMLGVPIKNAFSVDACVGAAMLARGEFTR